MSVRPSRRLLALLAAAMLLLSACTPRSGASGGALTWLTYNGYDDFLALLGERHPDIALDFISYTGSNRTGYSWAQMRADDIPDIFISSQILDPELASERLADLSGYDLVNSFPTAVLDQVAVDGGVYLLPVNYAVYGIFYNKTLMEEHHWELPENADELEALCAEIRAAGLIPGVISTQLTGGPFSAVFNLAKTDWLTTPEGVNWERDFLAGNASAAERWTGTMELVQRYVDMGMFTPDPEDRNSPQLILDYLGNRKAVFVTAVQTLNITELPETGDKLGIMPYIGEDGGKNVYMYSPTSYIGISRRLTQPGNEKKLENAVRLLSLLFSPEGQAAFINEQTPCVMSALNSADLPEDALIYDAQRAMREGRAFPMTYAGWDGVLADMGQVYKDWFRGENGVDGPAAIARMDELQRSFLDSSAQLYFCRSEADFTLTETARLFGKALGSAAGADAAMIPLGEYHGPGRELAAGVTGKLYAGPINVETVAALCPAVTGDCPVLTMTGAQAKELARTGFDALGDGEPFPYLLVTRGDAPLEDGESYQVAFLPSGLTEETAQSFPARAYSASLRELLRGYFTQQETVSPGGNPWT